MTGYLEIMKQRILAGFLGLALLASFARAGEPGLNRPLEPFRITTLSGHEITSATQRGRILVVNLWATWCGPCRTEMPEIEAFFQKYRNRGVDVVAVSLDDRRESAAVRRFMAPFSVPVALAADSDLRGFGRIRYLPATFVIDRDGLLKRSGWQQPASVDLPELEKALSPLLDAPADSPVVRSGG